MYTKVGNINLPISVIPIMTRIQYGKCYNQASLDSIYYWFVSNTIAILTTVYFILSDFQDLVLNLRHNAHRVDHPSLHQHSLVNQGNKRPRAITGLSTTHLVIKIIKCTRIVKPFRNQKSCSIHDITRRTLLSREDISSYRMQQGRI